MIKGFVYKKATQALNFFALKEEGNINIMKALKLIWLSDRWHLRNHGRVIIYDNYLAMKNGPVASNTRDVAQKTNFIAEEEIHYSNIYLDHVDYFICSKKEVDTKVFSKTDISTMELIYNHFGIFDQFELSEISHNYPEWKKFEAELKKGNQSRFNMDYIDFFKNPNSENHPIFEQENNFLNLAKDDFILKNTILNYGNNLTT